MKINYLLNSVLERSPNLYKDLSFAKILARNSKLKLSQDFEKIDAQYAEILSGTFLILCAVFNKDEVFDIDP